ncbi:DUF2284 domain-containing protein [Candidatus Bathyarchaeota archaeon]|nr:DUF2284 domain-containing protein [Candidatus Bathyarchaeota archaeon]
MKANGEIEKIKRLALKFDVSEAKVIKTSKIIVENWVNWKCRYGCPDYGKWLTCPPYAPKPEETKSLFKEYKIALLFRLPDKIKLYNILNKLEREFFLQGYYKAFGLGGGHCPYCEKCTLDFKACKNPLLARPSMEACGINVFETAKNAGFPIKILKEKNQKVYRFGLVLIK